MSKRNAMAVVLACLWFMLVAVGYFAVTCAPP